MSAPPAPRHRSDLCPGVFRPWPADDGLLVRLRLIGGHLGADSLVSLAAVSEAYGDGRVHLTGRANLQLRALPGDDGALRPDVVEAIAATGLLPSRTHELARNVMVSPQTGLAGGRTDLGAVATALDELLCADADLARLPGRFLFVLDDGRGDLLGRTCDLGLVALDAERCQLRVGTSWGEVVALESAAAALAGLARLFLSVRGTGPTAAWHVTELDAPLTPARPREIDVPPTVGPLPFGPVAGGHHVAVRDGVLTAGAARGLASRADALVVTPWHGVLVPAATR